MPRGKRTVYAGFCSECNARIATIRILKKNKSTFRELKKFCNVERKRQIVKLKEEKHSS